MNNQENQIPQFNYGATDEPQPQFVQPQQPEVQPQFGQPMQPEVQPQFGQPVQQEAQPQFGQPVQQEAQPQFGQPVQQEAQPQFGQPVQQEAQPQFGQPVQQEAQPQFGQPVQQEAQPQFGQPVQQEAQPQFGQPVQQGAQPPFGQPLAPVVKKEKKAKKEKQPKVKKEKIKSEKPEKENGKNSKKKLIVLITALLALLMLIGGGVLYYFYAIVGSTPVSAARILEKISAAEKMEGRLTDGNIIVKSGQEAQTLKLDNATYSFNRTVDKEKNRYMYIQTKLMLVKNSETPQPLVKDNVVAFTLRPNMKAEWSILGQKGSYQTSGKEKESLEQFVTKKNSDAQKNLDELRAFLVNGYRPSISVEGKKTTISMNKDDLEKIARKIEDNVKTDQEKFKNLLAKINPETDANEIIESCKNGELTKAVKENLLPNIESLKFEFVFNETSDKEIIGHMTLQVKPVKDDVKTTIELDIKTETTYTL